MSTFDWKVVYFNGMVYECEDVPLDHITYHREINENVFERVSVINHKHITSHRIVHLNNIPRECITGIGIDITYY